MTLDQTSRSALPDDNPELHQSFAKANTKNTTKASPKPPPLGANFRPS